MTVADQLFEQARQLPEPLIREALDFVLFLRARHERKEWRDLVDARTTALAETWDNEDNEAWNNVWGWEPADGSIPVYKSVERETAFRPRSDRAPYHFPEIPSAAVTA